MKPATPLPWKPFGPFVIDENENEVASGGYGIDAAYIAHACNLYPELVEACQLALEHKADEYRGTFDSRMDNDPLVIRLRAVLAKAKGE